jgi:3-hydroxymyristoyl/3-hydroxydecanoyl-(acyl carrier protein) dehydratase
MRARVGVLKGIARVDGQVVVEGTMTFALGPRSDAAEASAQNE